MYYGSKGELAGKIVTGVLLVGILGYGGYKLVGSTVGKVNSNRDLIDTEKSFNIVLEKTPNTVSVVKIVNYTDYQGDVVEFENEDGLRILTSIVNSSLMKEDKYADVYKYAEVLGSNKQYGAISYDKLQGNDLVMKDGWNKKLNNFNYNFDKAVEILEDGTIVVYEVANWKDREEDDKLQITTPDGRVWLTHFKNVRLIDTKNAEKGAFESYLVSLAGEQEKIMQYEDMTKNTSSNGKRKRLSL